MTPEFYEANPSLLTIEACAKLPTPRLLAYYKKKRLLRQPSEGWCECCSDYHNEADWEAGNEYMNGVKTLLDGREHVGREE